MKKCNACGAQVDEQARFCPTCGSAELVETKTVTQQLDQVQTNSQIFTPTYQVQSVDGNDEKNNGNGNILAGIVGAFLFSIIGGLIYFVIYQIGIVAGVCGLAIFILANFGYGLFAKTKNKVSVAGLITAIVATIVMIFVAEYFCLSFEIFQAYKEYGITIFDAIVSTPEFIAEPEIGGAVASDLAFAYMFGFIAIIGNVINIVKARKKR